MARGKRIRIPGLIRHVMCRGNARMTIFLDDEDYRKFVYLLSDVIETFEIDCLNYCAMPNHYHATLLPKQANLSEALRHLNSRYAQWWNERHQRVGHVFQGRFKDQVVQREGYLMALCRYIEMNPVRAGLVEHPADWRWSSYAAIAGLRPAPSFLAVATVLRQFGSDDEGTLKTRFSEFVVQSDTTDNDESCTDDRIRSREQVLGSKAFKVSVAAEARGVSALESRPPVSIVDKMSAV